MALMQSQIEQKLTDKHLDEPLDLWQAEQGAPSSAALST